jgi:hypothetical protein
MEMQAQMQGEPAEAPGVSGYQDTVNHLTRQSRNPRLAQETAEYAYSRFGAQKSTDSIITNSSQLAALFLKDEEAVRRYGRQALIDTASYMFERENFKPQGLEQMIRE